MLVAKTGYDEWIGERERKRACEREKARQGKKGEVCEKEKQNFWKKSRI